MIITIMMQIMIDIKYGYVLLTFFSVSLQAYPLHFGASKFDRSVWLQQSIAISKSDLS